MLYLDSTPITTALNMKVISPGIEAKIIRVAEKHDLFDQLFAFGQAAGLTHRYSKYGCTWMKFQSISSPLRPTAGRPNPRGRGGPSCPARETRVDGS